MFGALPGLHWARSLVLRLSDVPGQTRAWLAEIELAIGYGERKPDGPTLVLGLSASGLRKLGLDEQALSTFPTAFQHGMAAPWRARALGDVGINAPEGWCWGGPGKEADAILNLYALSDDILQQQTAQRKAQLLRFGIEVIYEILLDEMPPKKKARPDAKAAHTFLAKIENELRALEARRQAERVPWTHASC